MLMGRAFTRNRVFTKIKPKSNSFKYLLLNCVKFSNAAIGEGGGIMIFNDVEGFFLSHTLKADSTICIPVRIAAGVSQLRDKVLLSEILQGMHLG